MANGDIANQLFPGPNSPEMAKVLLTLDFGALMATPVIAYNKILPVYYTYVIFILLLVGFITLVSAILLRNIYRDPAGTLGLIGTACVFAVVPIITAGCLPMLGGFLVLVIVLILLMAIRWLVGRYTVKEIDDGVPPV